MADPTAQADAVDRQDEIELDADDVAVEEILVEEVSIDGMCGVY